MRHVRMPAPATVMSSIALFTSLSGVGYAAAQIGSAQIKDNSIATRDIKDRTIKVNDISSAALSSLRGSQGPEGSRGPAGANGTAGAPGAPGAPGVNGTNGSALAYAFVAADGTVDPTASNGIVLRATGDGTYCLQRSAGAVASFAATIYDVNQTPVGNSRTASGTAQPADIVAAGCPAGTNLLVTTRLNGNDTDEAFYVAVIA